MGNKKSKRPPEDLHTQDEVLAALTALTDVEASKLGRYASFKMAKLRWKALEKNKDDLIQEASLRIASGKRKWPKDITFLKFFSGVIDSVSSHWGSSVSEDEPFRESSLSLEEVSLDSILDTEDERNPEKSLIDRETIEQLTKHFENDLEVSLIIEALIEGKKKGEIAEYCDISIDVFKAADKRFRRKIQQDNS